MLLADKKVGSCDWGSAVNRCCFLTLFSLNAYQGRSKTAWVHRLRSLDLNSLNHSLQALGCHTNAAAAAYHGDAGVVAALLKQGYNIDTLLARCVSCCLCAQESGAGSGGAADARLQHRHATGKVCSVKGNKCIGLLQTWSYVIAACCSRVSTHPACTLNQLTGSKFLLQVPVD